MPDYPDDMPHDLDFSMFQNGGLTRGYMHHFATMAGDDGLSYYERKEQQRRKEQDFADKMADAMLLRDFESTTIPCIHDEECTQMECTANIENKRAAEEKYQKTIAQLSTSAKPKNPLAKKPAPKGPPSTLNSKSAAAALSQPKPKAAAVPAPKATSKPSFPFSKPLAILTRPKRTPQPSNPSPMRHTAASAASKTTIGHSRGRIASAALKKKSSVPPPVSSTNPHPDPQNRAQLPGTYLDEDEAEAEARAGANALENMWREEAEREFFLVL